MSRRSPRRPYDRNPRVRRDDPEPSVHDLLADPVLRLLMSRDGVSSAQLLDILDQARARLSRDEMSAHAAFEAMLFAECRA